MKTRFPTWVRGLALGAGLLDTMTGTGLVLLPAWTLQRMFVPPPGAEALGYVRFVGVFVAMVGLSYLVALRRNGDAPLRAVLDVTRLFRLGAGLFTGAMVLAAGWSPAWLVVTATDLGLVVVQSMILAGYGDESTHG